MLQNSWGAGPLPCFEGFFAKKSFKLYFRFSSKKVPKVKMRLGNYEISKSNFLKPTKIQHFTRFAILFHGLKPPLAY